MEVLNYQEGLKRDRIYLFSFIKFLPLFFFGLSYHSLFFQYYFFALPIKLFHSLIIRFLFQLLNFHLPLFFLILNLN